MKALIIGVIILFVYPLRAQFNLGFKETNQTLSFSIAGDDLNMACAGGFNTPQFSFIDLDFDGNDDLFVFDRTNDVIRTFLYDSFAEEYHYAPEYERLFPTDLEEFALLKDYDCDGKADIFTYYQAGFRVYRNTGVSELSFEKIIDKVRSNYGSFESNAFVLAGDIPAIVDLDNDGDLDILTFGTVNSENTIEFHRNLSQELYNTCDSLEFEVATQCWGKVEEPSNSSELNAISCKGIVPPDHRGARHAGSSVLLIDSDNDGDKDLVLGDVQTNSVVYAINIGDESEATIDVNQQTTNFPNAIDPVQINYLVSGFELDVDHDGNKDLIMTVNNSVDSSENSGHVWHYKNSSSAAASYQLQTKEFLIGEMLDLGSNTSPAALDVNGDGLMDLLIANDYLKNSTQSTKSRIHYFKQEIDGSFTLIDDDFAQLSALGIVAANISLGDMDGDGDQDLIAGDGEGSLHYFQNDPVGNEAHFALQTAEYMGISLLSNASPFIADLNEDNLPDLLVGDLVGKVHYFENTGTITNPQFSSNPTIQALGGIDISKGCCVGHANPYLVDNPAFGGDRYLFVGTDEKRIDIFRIPTELTSPFERVDSLFFNAGRLSPLPIDLDGNGIYEMLCGTGEGGIKFYSRSANFAVGLSQPIHVSEEISFSIFPNPANASTKIQFSSEVSGSIDIIDLSGRLLDRRTLKRESQITINTLQYSSGIYFVKFQSNLGQLSKAISILH